MSSLRLDCLRATFPDACDDRDTFFIQQECTLRPYQAAVISISALLTLFLINFASSIIYENILEGSSFGTILKGTISKAGKSLWLILFVAEVSSAIWIGTALKRRTPWLEVLLAVDFGAIVGLAHWIALFIIVKVGTGILAWRKKMKEKLRHNSSC